MEMTTVMVMKTYSSSFSFLCIILPGLHKCHTGRWCQRPALFCVAQHLGWVGNNAAGLQMEGIARRAKCGFGFVHGGGVFFGVGFLLVGWFFTMSSLKQIS